jgi:RHS repeat-associated protein
MATVDPWTDDGGDNTEYFHTNHLGTTRFMSEPDGDPADAAVYTAFGELVSGTNHRYGYDGAYGYQAHDFPAPEEGGPIPYLHVGARYYDPASGRFLQRDPIGIFGGLNVYAYCLNNPAIFVDPSGCGFLGDIVKGVGKAIAGAVSGAVTGAVAGAIVGAIAGGPAGAIAGAAAGAIGGAVAGGVSAGIAVIGSRGKTSTKEAVVVGAVAGIVGGVIPGAIAGGAGAGTAIAIGGVTGATVGGVTGGIRHGPKGAVVGVAVGTPIGCVGGMAGAAEQGLAFDVAWGWASGGWEGVLWELW